VTHLSERDAIDYLCTDLVQRNSTNDEESQQSSSEEETPLLTEELQPDEIQSDEASDAQAGAVSPKDYQQLNALEIAAGLYNASSTASGKATSCCGKP
jgi:hypothetical protein